jgi:hypothetical protein
MVFQAQIDQLYEQYFIDGLDTDWAPAVLDMNTYAVGDKVTIQLDGSAGSGTGVSTLHIEIDKW